MSKNEIIDFLLEKQGYLKEGAERLSKKLGGVDPELCLEALREARNMVKEDTDDIHANLVLKSRWQGPNGEWRESYRAVDSNDGLEELKGLKDSLVSDLKNITKLFPTTDYTNKEEDKVALEVNLPDFHFGKLDGSSIQEQSKLYLESIKEIIDKSSCFNIDRIILPIGNDLLNSEGMRLSTTKGTPQNDNSDWRINFRAAWTSIVGSIGMLSQVAPVTVVTVLGNHDYERTFYIGELLYALFFENENITVINSHHERDYIVYGNNLLAYTHGDKIKPMDLPLIMATEAPLEFANSKVRSWRLGHLHKHMKDEYRGIEVEFLPSLCGSDEWHRNMGYHTDRKAMAYIWDFNGGKAGFIQINK